MSIPRSSGIQLHLTSLPGGRLGPEARAFVDWLQAAGQSWWQTLPLGPPDEYRSPYKSASAFAAWNGFLEDPDAPVSAAEEDGFRARHGFWVTDWESFAGDGAVADQVRFEREWSALRTYAAERGVRMIGDVPIYVAPDGADHRAHPELFRDGVVSGAPPDAYSDKGQFWANPVYDWPALQRRGYRWWTERFRRTFDLFDLARIDHFRGFVSYWAVPEDAPDASYGRWARGPGRAVFDAAAKELRPDLEQRSRGPESGGPPVVPGDADAGPLSPVGLPLIAEDLGVITPAVERLRDGLGLPGMVVLQFAFDPDDPHGPHRPENHRERQVLYTGTHDNDTLRGWWESITDARRAETDAAIDAAGVRQEEPWWSLVALAQSSRASLCMLQVQDLLGLGSEHRMNVPGEQGGSWGYRLESGQLTAGDAARLQALSAGAGR